MPDNLLARIGVLTISDRASRGEYKDVVAQALTEMSDREGRPNPEPPAAPGRRRGI